MHDVVHEITAGENGSRVATDGTLVVSLMEPDGRMFKRRAIRRAGTQEAEEVCWLVVELDGVRVYQRGSQIIVSRIDMYP